jgi:XRE family transcriptional regulator, aerobic/anaerobic benzoate catabolism transcriptional regulator
MAPGLNRLGARVRALRTERGWSMRQLAARCAISERFLRDLEAGRGNVSVVRLARLAEALGRNAATLVAEAEQSAPPEPVSEPPPTPPRSRARGR